MKNNYKIENGVVIVEIISKGVTYEMLIDEEDFKFISEVARSTHLNKGYASVVDSEGKKQRIHRFILGNPEGKVIDHINGNKLDNRRANLRAVTVKENNRNLNNKYTPGRSGHKGIGYYPEDKSPWRVVIRRKHKGSFATLEEAIEKANKVYEELKKEFKKDVG